jgi:tetratricopeptide (TPR) repeat protein
MSVYQSEDRRRLLRIRSDKAIQLAMQSRWEEAADFNRQILELFPQDVDTHNRLGKALLELGRYADSLGSYQQAARLDPTSTIAQKNIQRLTKLVEEEQAPILPPTPLDPKLFIEESGRTAVTTLVDVASAETLASLNPGDPLTLAVKGHRVSVLDPNGEPVGNVEPKLGQRVVRLVGLGNRYSAAVTSADEQSVRVILRETHRDPSMGNRPSFPTMVTDAGRAYTRDILRYDVEEEDDDGLEDGERDEARLEPGLDEGASDEGVLAEES